MNIQQAQALVRELGLSPDAVTTDTVGIPSTTTGIVQGKADPADTQGTRLTLDREVFERIREKRPELRAQYVEAILTSAYGEARAQRLLRDMRVRETFSQLADAKELERAHAPVARVDGQDVDSMWYQLQQEPTVTLKAVRLATLLAGRGFGLVGNTFEAVADGIAKALPEVQVRDVPDAIHMTVDRDGRVV